MPFPAALHAYQTLILTADGVTQLLRVQADRAVLRTGTDNVLQ